jgi:hypothetical protein
LAVVASPDKVKHSDRIRALAARIFIWEMESLAFAQRSTMWNTAAEHLSEIGIHMQTVALDQFRDLIDLLTQIAVCNSLQNFKKALGGLPHEGARPSAQYLSALPSSAYAKYRHFYEMQIELISF